MKISTVNAFWFKVISKKDFMSLWPLTFPNITFLLTKYTLNKLKSRRRKFNNQMNNLECIFCAFN